jgi:hypothetical protein
MKWVESATIDVPGGTIANLFASPITNAIIAPATGIPLRKNGSRCSAAVAPGERP